MLEIRSVAVFCGASSGDDPVYHREATRLGVALAQAGLRLVYGGGRIGLMGAVADGALSTGGTVVGVIPDFLSQREVAHAGVSELIVTDSMHTRKRRMFELADAFVILPGGLGTYDETFEILTWRQLGLHDKPVLLCNVAGSALPLLAAIDSAIAAGFAAPVVRRLFDLVEGVSAVVDRLRAFSVEPAGQPGRL